MILYPKNNIEWLFGEVVLQQKLNRQHRYKITIVKNFGGIFFLNFKSDTRVQDRQARHIHEYNTRARSCKIAPKTKENLISVYILYIEEAVVDYEGLRRKSENSRASIPIFGIFDRDEQCRALFSSVLTGWSSSTEIGEGRLVWDLGFLVPGNKYVIPNLIYI